MDERIKVQSIISVSPLMPSKMTNVPRVPVKPAVLYIKFRLLVSRKNLPKRVGKSEWSFESPKSPTEDPKPRADMPVMLILHVSVTNIFAGFP